ncbi:hypothetical protein D3C84_685720 [compost metagenome]
MRIVIADPEHTGIDAFFLQRLDLRRRGHFVQSPVDLRIALAKQVQGPRQHTDHDRTDHADFQFAQLAAAGLTRQVQRAVELFEHQRRLFLEHLPGGGQFDPVVAALEQRRAQLLLQQADLLAQRWLADVQPGGGATEVQLFGQRHEVTQQSQVHAGQPRFSGVER